MTNKLDKLSSAVSLTVLEIDYYPNELVPAFLLANLMSPALWAWRSEKRAFANDGSLLSAKNRLNQLQRFFHRYTFIILPDKPGGDLWGLLSFPEEEKRFGADFIERIRAEYDATFRKLLNDNPESQFGQIVNQSYYREGFFPRLKNETLEVMNAFARTDPEGKRAGKCIGLGMLWAAAIAVWGRFPLDWITITGNRAHMFVYLDEEEGHLLNNTKWFSGTRINNQSELSNFVREVASGTETTFFYIPAVGMCHCPAKKSEIPRERITEIYDEIGDFVSIPLKHPNPETINFVQSSNSLPDPLEYESALEYQTAVAELAKQFPDSIYEFALYAFRSLAVTHPQAYVRAAARDYHTKQLAQAITSLDDALKTVAGVAGRDSVFESRERMAMPDETLIFNTGDDRDRALLLYTLLQGSAVADEESVIGLSDTASFVRHRKQWINAASLESAGQPPINLKLIFNADDCEKDTSVGIAG
jgi:hypothetical protein